MNIQQQINILQTRQLELLAIMAESDDHAAKCMKMGASFRDTYPDKFAAYQAANNEYNANEMHLVKLDDQHRAEENNIKVPKQ